MRARPAPVTQSPTSERGRVRVSLTGFGSSLFCRLSLAGLPLSGHSVIRRIDLIRAVIRNRNRTAADILFALQANAVGGSRDRVTISDTLVETLRADFAAERQIRHTAGPATVTLKVSLPTDEILARLARVLRSPEKDSDSFDLLARPIYGRVVGNKFSMRRAAWPRMRMHGELVAIVVDSGAGSSLIEIKRRGLDWGLIYSLIPFSAALFAVHLLRNAGLAEVSILFAGLGVMSFAIGLYCIVAVLHDWRILQARLLEVLPETMPPA